MKSDQSMLDGLKLKLLGKGGVGLPVGPPDKNECNVGLAP
jgi:hypothetical protein